jgi:GNAT superfamily N-acetyltransferase
MTDASDITVVRASAAHPSAITAFFERAGCTCYCRFWHFPGDKNAWLERGAHRPEENRNEFVSALAAGSAEAEALVAATEAGSVVGWMKFAPASEMQKLYSQRPYRTLKVLEPNRRDALVIGCFLVDPAFRGRGVASRLAAAAREAALRQGARCIEAFPFDGTAVSAELLWTGPASTLLRLGFREVARVGPYPILRLEL